MNARAIETVPSQISMTADDRMDPALLQKLVTGISRPEHERDLTWFLSGEYEGDLGMTSVTGRQIMRLQTYGEFGLLLQFTRHISCDVSDEQEEAADRANKVSSRWGRLSALHQGVLAAMYSRKPSDTPDRWGSIAPVIPHCAEARSAYQCYAQACSSTPQTFRVWLEHLSDKATRQGDKARADRSLKNQISMAADALFADAVAAYQRASGRRMDA